MTKTLLITISIFLLFGFWQICEAQEGQELLVDYPEIGEIKPGSGTSLPVLIKYIYFFALGAVGFAALLAIIIGAIMYVFSAGNPTKAADAKDRILSAILGIILLLASVLILRTINPNIIEFKLDLKTIPLIPVIEEGEGERGWACYCCCYLKPWKCDPFNQPMSWCSTTLPQTQADNDCLSDCKVSCFLSAMSQIVSLPCP